MKVLIDNGHGSNTAGKCSPDGTLREYAYTREIAKRIVEALNREGYDAERIVTEETDISLKERCARVNAVCRKLGTKNVLLISVHNNAAGSGGQWMTARGFSAHVSLNASSGSKQLAKLLWQEAIKLGLKGNRSVPSEMYITQNLAMCRDTMCAAVLTENLFQDNKEDVSFLLSEEGKSAITALHVEGIKSFIKSVS